MTDRTVQALVVAMLLTATFSVQGFAETHPIADCPIGFHLHEVAQHHDGEAHFHAGTTADQNGDGWICATHVSSDGSIHLHIDNTVRSG